MNRQLKLYALICCLLMAVPAKATVQRALLFGLGKQEDTRWCRIHGDNDIVYVRQLLKTAGYTDIKVLTNEQATKRAMVQAFEDLAARCRKGDVVYIHYSGHGQLMTDLNGDEATRWTGRHAGWDEAWVPYDAYMTYGTEDRGEKHLSDDEIAELLMKIRNKIGEKGQITVAVDACHSGDATCGVGEECVRGIDVKFNIPKRIATVPRARMEERWRTISACKPYQICTEMKDLNIGKLTYALCSLGTRFFEMGNEELETVLGNFMDMYKGKLPQQPMVSGHK